METCRITHGLFGHNVNKSNASSQALSTQVGASDVEVA